MKLIIYFDASYSETLKTAGLAFIVKDEYDKILHKFSGKIFCKNSCDAELRALNKAIGFILAQQSKCLIPKGSTIIIYGDNQSVIEISKNMKHIRKIHKGLMTKYLEKIRELCDTNEVSFRWINRKLNVEADKESRKVFNL